MDQFTTVTCTSLSKEQFNEARRRSVAKRNDMIQRGRSSLTLVENKAVLYLLSKVKPDDQPNTEYRFNCEEFYAITNNRSQSYTGLKNMLKAIADKSWFIDDADGITKLVRWFNIVHLEQDRGTRYATITFHQDLWPYILDLNGQYEREGLHYTMYRLQNISLMKHRFSDKIYELLKTYENRRTWIFELGTGTANDLQVHLAPTVVEDKKTRKAISVIPKSWSKFTFFDRDVLRPAKEEINRYTDLMIDYEGLQTDLHGVKHRKIVAVRFVITEKTQDQKTVTERLIEHEYAVNEDARQFRQSTVADFLDEQNMAVQEEKARKSEEVINASRYPAAAGVFEEFGFSISEIENLIDTALTHLAPGRVSRDSRELWAIDFVDYYNRMVQATLSQTKTFPYNRLLDMVRKDYDDFAEQLKKYDHKNSTRGVKVLDPYEEKDMLDLSAMSDDELDSQLEVLRMEKANRKKRKGA